MISSRKTASVLSQRFSTIILSFGEDRISCSRPHERTGVFVIVFDELLYVAYQLAHASEQAAPNTLLCNQSEPPLHLIKPRGVCWGIMHVISRTRGKPCPHLGVLVCRIVVDNEVHIKVSRDVGVNMMQKRQKLLMPVTRLALSKYLA